MGNSSGKKTSANIIMTAPFRTKIVAEQEIFRKNIIIPVAYDHFELFIPQDWHLYFYTDSSHIAYETSSKDKLQRGESKFRVALTTSLEKHRGSNSWIIDINTNADTTFDCSLFFPPISQTLCEDLVMTLNDCKVVTAFNLCLATHDVLVQAAEMGYEKILRIEFSEYITEDRVAFIVRNICQWLEK